MKKEWDIIIIGAGPAGLTAALYTSRAQLRTLIIGYPERSNISKAKKVFNYPGFPEGISGTLMQKKFLEQARKYGSAVLENEVVNIKKSGKVFSVKTSGNKLFSCKAILIASGRSHAKCGVKGEDAFNNKGVHYCAVCDGYAYRGKRLVVIGNGDHAAEEAMELVPYSDKIEIFLNGLEDEMSPQLRKDLRDKGIGIREEKVLEFRGSAFLEKMLLEGGEEPVGGVFVASGTTSAVSFANKLAIDMEGDKIKAGRDGETSVEGIFAAGDCCGGSPQAIKSAGEGCSAALAAAKFLRGNVWIDYGKR